MPFFNQDDEARAMAALEGYDARNMRPQAAPRPQGAPVGRPSLPALQRPPQQLAAPRARPGAMLRDLAGEPQQQTMTGPVQRSGTVTAPQRRGPQAAPARPPIVAAPARRPGIVAAPADDGRRRETTWDDGAEDAAMAALGGYEPPQRSGPIAAPPDDGQRRESTWSNERALVDELSGQPRVQRSDESPTSGQGYVDAEGALAGQTAPGYGGPESAPAQPPQGYQPPQAAPAQRPAPQAAPAQPAWQAPIAAPAERAPAQPAYNMIASTQRQPAAVGAASAWNTPATGTGQKVGAQQSGYDVAPQKAASSAPAFPRENRSPAMLAHLDQDDEEPLTPWWGGRPKAPPTQL